MRTQQERLIDALVKGSMVDAKVALEDGANVNARGPDRLLPLQIAASNGFLELVRLLLENGADVNVNNEWFRTPLNAKVKLGDALDIALLLIENGARFNETTQAVEQTLAS